MIKNGVTVIHLATGFLMGYPSYPSIDHFVRFMEERYKLRVIVGPPIPAKYLAIHERLGTWKAPEWNLRLEACLSNERTHAAYD